MKASCLTCCIFAGLLVASASAQSTQPSSELQKGVEAFKASRYEQAIFHFRNAVAENDRNVKAHLYLATALAQEYIPGVDTPDNKQSGEDALKEYQKVCTLDPDNLNCVKGIAYLDLQMKRFQEAKTYYRKAIDLDPNDPETYYSVGVIDWMQAYQPRMEQRAKLGIAPEKPLIEFGECWTVHDLNEGIVREGMEMLTKAISLRPDYDDAMAYMNLLYRERADIQCNDQAAYSVDTREADNWVDRTMATKKQKAERTERQKQPSVPGPER